MNPVKWVHILQHYCYSLSPYVFNDFWHLWAIFKVWTGLTKTNGHDKPEFKFNSTFTLHPQEMITTENHLINACLCEWPERPWGSIQEHLQPHTHERDRTSMNTQAYKGNLYSTTSLGLLTLYKLLPFAHNHESLLKSHCSWAFAFTLSFGFPHR